MTDIEKIQQLWIHLERVLYDDYPGATSPPLIRLQTPPWESSEPAVRLAWTEITNPKNLEVLIQWQKTHLLANKTSRSITNKAIEECEKRLRSDPSFS